jgi:hypothetical protein
MAFIDLSAGPFEYGPTVSGEGVRTQYTLPKVPQRQQFLDELQGKQGE